MTRRSHPTTLAGVSAWITDPGEHLRVIHDASGALIMSEITDGVTASPHEIVAYDVGDEAAGATLASTALEWAPGLTVEEGDIVQHDGVVYRTVQPHGTQVDWPPAAVPALFARVGPVGATGPQPWLQPLGAHDMYRHGDKVTHNGQVWIAVVDNNVWEPGVFGWEVVP